MPVQPIRLFGDPVLRTPADPVRDFDKELRTLVKDLTDTMLDAPGVGLAAPQIGVGLRVFTYYVDDALGPPGQPRPRPRPTTSRTARRAACPSRAWPSRPSGRCGVVAKGMNMHGEPVTIEGTELLARCVQHETDHLDGILFIDRLDREQRKLAMQAIREAEWSGRDRARRQGVPARHCRASAVAGGRVRLVFAGTPEAAAAVPRGPAGLPPRRRRGGHPAGRTGGPRPARSRRSPVARSRRARRSRGAQARRRRATPSSSTGCASWRRTASRWWPTARWSRRAALGIPRHGWVNLHFSLLPAWRGAAPVQHAVLHGDDVTGATTFLLEEGLDTGPVFGTLTEPVRAADTSGDLLDRLARAGAGLLVATLDGIESGDVVGVPQPADGVSLAPKLGTDDARVDWTSPAQHVDRLVRACTPAPGRLDDSGGERLGLGPVSPAGGGRAGPGRGAGGEGARAGGRRRRARRRARRGAPGRQAPDGGRGLGPRRA